MIHACIIEGGTVCVNFIIVVICSDFDHLMTSQEPQKVKAKAQYTGTSKSTKYRRSKQAKNKREKEILLKIPRLESFFVRSVSTQPQRTCSSEFATRNNNKRAVAQSLDNKKRKRNENPISTKGHSQHAKGAVKNRTRRLAKKSRCAVKLQTKRAEAQPELPCMPKKTFLLTIIQKRIQSLRKLLRSNSRLSVANSKTHYNMWRVLQQMSTHVNDYREGQATISIGQAVEMLTGTVHWRTKKHLKTFIESGMLSVSSRGGKRQGHSLLDDPVFRDKATLWLKDKMAAHTKWRLRAMRKDKSFKSQASRPIDEKVTTAITSAGFARYITDELLSEFYAEDAVKARVQRVAEDESKLSLACTCMYRMSMASSPIHRNE